MTVIPADAVMDVLRALENLEDLSQLFLFADVMAVDDDHVADRRLRVPDDLGEPLFVHGCSFTAAAAAAIGGLVDLALGKLRSPVVARYRSCGSPTSVIVAA